MFWSLEIHKLLYKRTRTKARRRLPEREAAQIFKDIVEGIAYCHEKNVIHRDIKLENIMIDENGTIKIIDFGFSIVIPKEKKLSIFCGTPSYMAPEIVKKRNYYGQMADTWALGVLLYAMLCGKFPFKGHSDKELFRKIAKVQF